MLKNAYLLAKIGADTAENEQKFVDILSRTARRPRLAVDAWPCAPLAACVLLAIACRLLAACRLPLACCRRSFYCGGLANMEGAPASCITGEISLVFLRVVRGEVVLPKFDQGAGHFKLFVKNGPASSFCRVGG